MNDLKRAALFLRSGDDEEIRLKRVHDFLENHSEYVVTICLKDESQFLATKENFDVILTTDTIHLPIAGIEIIRV